MEHATFTNLLKQIDGCTFASLDAECAPQPNVREVINGERVILFTNQKGESGYEAMVKRRLIEAGKDPDTFVVSDLPWGERVPNTPLIYHSGKDRYYLQCIVLSPGNRRYFIGNTPVSADDLGIKSKWPHHQGLPPSDAVYVHTYALENITRISLLGEVFTAGKRDTLRLNYSDINTDKPPA